MRATLSNAGILLPRREQEFDYAKLLRHCKGSVRTRKRRSSSKKRFEKRRSSQNIRKKSKKPKRSRKNKSGRK